MSFKTFTSATLSSADVNTYLMKQAVIGCTSSTRPTGVEGMVISESDTDRLWTYSGTGWVFLGYYSTAGRPGVVLTDAAQSIASGAFADITWGTEVSDVDGWTSGGIATLTVPSGWDGRYMISYTGLWASSTLGTTPQVMGLWNGNSFAGAGGLVAAGVHSFSVVQTLAATDTLKFQAFQNSGGAVNIVSRLEIAWLGR